MASTRKKLGELLLSLRLVSAEQLEHALELQARNSLPLGTILVQTGAISEDLLLNALAAQIGVWPWRLDQNPPDQNAVKKVTAQLCVDHQVLPVALRGDLLILAMVNPHDVETIERVRKETSYRIEPVLADAERLIRAIESAHGMHQMSENLDDLVDAALKDFKVDRKSDRNSNQITEADTRPVVGLVNQILTDAIRCHASDVHIEPRHDRVEIRYRVDGQMQVARTMPATLLPMVATRLKIMAEIDIVEFRVPQDGRVSVQIDGREVDLRVSVLPNHHGPRIVLRILDKSISLKRLSELGFKGGDLDLFRNLVSKPYGMFLVTGPTGSGKTTTLYAALGEIRTTANNVMTCEDPVEYEIDGVNQSQVNEKVGLTFARQLRAILRQDPDVILVGEVRDGETAETAMRAALTGHMVLTTLHCNDAPSAIPRLLDMGTDPFMLSTSLVGVMSQRLVRQLCPHCKRPDRANAQEQQMFAAYGVHGDQVFRPKGCRTCAGTGYRGRAAVHEIMPVTPAVARRIADREPIETIRDTAAAYGYVSMAIRVLEMVIEGRTSLEEAQRVVFLDVNHGAQATPQVHLHAA